MHQAMSSSTASAVVAPAQPETAAPTPAAPETAATPMVWLLTIESHIPYHNPKVTEQQLGIFTTREKAEAVFAAYAARMPFASLVPGHYVTEFPLDKVSRGT